MIDDSKWVGTFESKGVKFTIETPGSSVITKKTIVERFVVSIHEVTEFGTILKQERYLNGVLTETTLGHIKVLNLWMIPIVVLINGMFLSETRMDLCKNIQSIILKPVLVQQIQNKYQLLV